MRFDGKLHARREALRARHREIAAELAEVEQQIESREREAALALYYVRVVCERCKGAGEEEEMGGFDGEDPPFMDACPGCQGHGWKWARRWSGRKGLHDTAYDERRL